MEHDRHLRPRIRAFPVPYAGRTGGRSVEIASTRLDRRIGTAVRLGSPPIPFRLAEKPSVGASRRAHLLQDRQSTSCRDRVRLDHIGEDLGDVAGADDATAR
jgi:hypothetical protein